MTEYNNAGNCRIESHQRSKDREIPPPMPKDEDGKKCGVPKKANAHSVDPDSKSSFRLVASNSLRFLRPRPERSKLYFTDWATVQDKDSRETLECYSAVARETDSTERQTRRRVRQRAGQRGQFSGISSWVSPLFSGAEAHFCAEARKMSLDLLLILVKEEN